MKNPIHKLFQNLIWPAVAGNVAWSFFSIIIMEFPSVDIFVYTRLVLLFLLAIYLGDDWMVTEKEADNLKDNYWIGDAFHSIAITFLALSIYSNKEESMFWSSILVLTIPIIAHIFGCWELKNDSENKFKKRISLAAIDGLGLIFFILSYFTFGKNCSYTLSIFVVIVAWLKYRDSLYYSRI